MLKELARRRWLEEQEQAEVYRELKSTRLHMAYVNKVDALQKEQDAQRKRWRRYRA